jgi:hypothetical protein
MKEKEEEQQTVLKKIQAERGIIASKELQVMPPPRKAETRGQLTVK